MMLRHSNTWYKIISDINSTTEHAKNGKAAKVDNSPHCDLFFSFPSYLYIQRK